MKGIARSVWQFAGLVDVTIVYRPTGNTRSKIWSWLCGEQNAAFVQVEVKPLPVLPLAAAAALTVVGGRPSALLDGSYWRCVGQPTRGWSSHASLLLLLEVLGIHISMEAAMARCSASSSQGTAPTFPKRP